MHNKLREFLSLERDDKSTDYYEDFGLYKCCP
jgi:hypothetical protein